MSSAKKDGGGRFPLRMIFEGAAVGLAAISAVTAVMTGDVIPALGTAAAASAAYLLKKR